VLELAARCPELVSTESLSIAVRDHPDLPDDSFGLVEFYCTERKCDCRRVLLMVVRLSEQRVVATLNFGWETVAFYRKWSRSDSRPEDLRGLTIDPLHPQTELSEPLRELFEESFAEDPSLVALFKRHYALFKRRGRGRAR
jgi:hypothetical protein